MYVFFSVLLSSLLLSLAQAAGAQTSVADLNRRLVGKPLYLRGFWGDDTLHFNANGQLIGSSEQVPFTLSGIDVRTVRLEKDSLILDGNRVGLEFKDNVPKRVALKSRKRFSSHKESIHITIDAPQDGDFTRALDGTFAENLSDQTLSFAPEWQPFVRKHFFHGSDAVPEGTDPGPSNIGGSIKPPSLLKTVEPQFSMAAKDLLYSNLVLVNVYVDETGKPYHTAIVRPAGLGLDEQALAAIQQYRFRPATENGEPISVQLNVEVQFKVF
jgi:TonB family protein